MKCPICHLKFSCRLGTLKNGHSHRKTRERLFLLVNDLPSEQVLTWMLSSCPQSWALAICYIGNQLQKQIVVHHFCKFLMEQTNDFSHISARFETGRGHFITQISRAFLSWNWQKASFSSSSKSGFFLAFAHFIQARFQAHWRAF